MVVELPGQPKNILFHRDQGSHNTSIKYRKVVDIYCRQGQYLKNDHIHRYTMHFIFRKLPMDPFLNS